MDFQVNLNLLGWFLSCVLLENFIKFLVDPYYESLLLLMIWRNRHFLHVAKNQENDGLYFQLCFADTKEGLRGF